MFQFFNKRGWIARCLIAGLVVAAIYAGGRLYYHLTGGFLLSNIIYEFPYEEKWEAASLSEDEKTRLDTLLAQPYHYLGKGCQSYVFSSDDGRYVIKFFKYQRFRPQEWLSYFSFVPAVDVYRQGKIEKKKRKLDGVLTSWKLAYENLQPETGVVYVHLNKKKEFETDLIIYDKIGFQHSIDLNNVEFLVQEKAEMLCPTLLKLMREGRREEAERILGSLVAMLEDEYKRGYADNDHALMQNTGVIEGRPVHIDVGQFIKNPIVQSPDLYHQELFNKMYKFRKWLEKNAPPLFTYLDGCLAEVIGEKFWSMEPVLYTADMARIPNAS